jgi:TatD DNase family protein
VVAGWVDSHCHTHDLDDPASALAAARDAGVVGVVCVGTDLAASRRAVAVASDHAGVYATVGLHPHDAARLEDEWDGLVALAAAPEVVGVGESGFDLHYRHAPEDVQEAAFRRHIGLAKECDLTLVIHTREAWGPTFSVLTEEGPPTRTVFHCFTGGPDDARRALDLGAWLSFSGIVTFAGADDVRAAAAVAPADRILVETDAPYLTPHPLRGRPNEPAYVVHVGAGLAAARGESGEAVAEATSRNARTAFALP